MPIPANHSGKSSMMLKWRIGRCCFLLITLAVSSGFVVSKEGLFDQSEFVTPFAAGRYESEFLTEGVWQKRKSANVLSSSGSYLLSDINTKLTISLVAIDGRYFVGMGESNGGAIYGILEPRDGKLLIYAPDCADLKKALPPDQPEPITESRWPLTICLFDNRERLLAALMAYAKISEPSARISPVFETSHVAPPPLQVQTAIETAALKLCNESDEKVSTILFHRHLYQPDKMVLEGWFTVSPRECKTFRSFPVGEAALFAKTADGSLEWAGAVGGYCISQRQTQRVIYDRENCIAGEVRKGFRPISLSAGENSYTFSTPKR